MTAIRDGRGQRRTVPLYNEDGLRWCPNHSGGTGAYLPVSAFGKNKRRTDGLQTYCNPCRQELNLERRRNGYKRRYRTPRHVRENPHEYAENAPAPLADVDRDRARQSGLLGARVNYLMNGSDIGRWGYILGKRPDLRDDLYCVRLDEPIHPAGLNSPPETDPLWIAGSELAVDVETMRETA